MKTEDVSMLKLIEDKLGIKAFCKRFSSTCYYRPITSFFAKFVSVALFRKSQGILSIMQKTSNLENLTKRGFFQLDCKFHLINY